MPILKLVTSFCKVMCQFFIYFMCQIASRIYSQLSEDKEIPPDLNYEFLRDGNFINLDYGPSRSSMVPVDCGVSKLQTDYLKNVGCEEGVNHQLQ